MKRKFTFLNAALALLVLLALPMGMKAQTTISTTMSEYVMAHGCAVSSGSDVTCYTELTLDDNITMSTSGEPNCGSFWGANTREWRLYQNKGGDVTITAASDYSLSSVKFTFTSNNNGVLLDGSNVQLESGVTDDVSGSSSVTYIVGNSGSATNGQIRITAVEVVYTSTGGDTPTPTTYTVTYDANGGTGTMTDSNSPYNAGATVTVLGNEFTRTDYEFDHWNTAADNSGDSYDEDDIFTINANTTLYAQWTENITPGPGGNTQTLTFNLSSNPGGWPTTNSTTLTNYTYTLNSVNYTFALKNVKCNSGYLMMTATAVLGLPAIEGYKLTKVVASNSSNCSTSVKVGISSSATQENYIAGGAIQTWSTQSSSYTYNLTSTEPNTMYFMYVTSKNAQVLGLELTYEADGSAPAPTIMANEVNVAYDATSGSIVYTINNVPSPAGTLTASVPQNSWLTLGTVGATVPFTCSQNPTSTARTETVTLTYTYNTNETATTTVTVTQAGNPNMVDLISDINAVNTNYTIRGTVVAVNARGCVIGDGTGYINFYNGYTAPEVAVNDVVTVSGSMTSYGNIYQFSNNSPNTATIVTAESSNYDGNPAITVINVIPTSTYSSGLHLSDYFQFEGTLTKSSEYYYVSVGEGQINIAYPSSDQQTAMNALENKTVRVTGYFAGINSSSYFSVMMESIEEVASTEPYITIESDEFELTAGGEEGYLGIAYDNFTITSASDFAVQFYDAENNELNGAAAPTWIQAEVTTQTGEEGYFVHYVVGENTDTEDRTAYFRVLAMGDNDFVSSNLVTVTQAAPVVDYAVLPFIWAGGTSGDLTANSGVSGNSLGDYAAGNAPYRVKFDKTGDYILIKTNEQPAVVSVGIKKVGGDGNSSIVIQSSSNGTDFTDVETFSNPGAQNDMMTHVTTNAFNASDRYVRIYFNKPSDGANVGVGPITIRGIETYTLGIAKHGATTADGGWYLIASPVASVTPYTDNGFIATTATNYDLYYFDQDSELEWRNYKQTPFDLVSGKGYLYANGEENGTTLTFTGTPYVGNGEVPLTYTAGKEFAGFNLIGNPFSTVATIDMPFYRMNGTGSALVASTESGQNQQIAAKEGVFVYAYDETNSQAIETATFTAASRSGNAPQGIVNLNAEHNASIVDNAIIRFDGGLILPKFMLNENSTKLYIEQNGKDYAIVSAEAQGEMPVSFRAAKNGTYTLTINPEGVEMNYLHLIDNMTGIDIDLLQTPNYTFESRTTDYTSRFRLVFGANGASAGSASDETFAYFNGSEWMINNSVDATLQVVDVMGRVLSSEAVNGSVSKAINTTAGVYMLRLINGNDVKTQKIVVR